MFYEFPTITHLNDVVPYVQGNPAFGVMDRGPFVIVNYHFQAQDTFTGPHEAILRECRGLVFDKASGLILNRRFHKFFNVNEKPETQAHLIPWGNMLTIMEKLDGSMVSPVAVEGALTNIRWITKMGITETSLQAEVFIARNPHYAVFAKDMLKWGYTPIFEWCSQGNRVVIDHAEDRLVLIGVRNTTTGEYARHETLVDQGLHYGFPVVNSFHAHKEMTLFLEAVKYETDKEGYVVTFENGHMLKAKTEWYVGIHKTKEALDNPRLVILAYLEGTLDDLVAMLPEEDAKKVEDIAQEHWQWQVKAQNRLYQVLMDYRLRYDRKTFAIEQAKNEPFSPVIFAAWDDGSRVIPAFTAMVKKTLQSVKTYENEYLKLREMI